MIFGSIWRIGMLIHSATFGRPRAKRSCGRFRGPGKRSSELNNLMSRYLRDRTLAGLVGRIIVSKNGAKVCMKSPIPARLVVASRCLLLGAYVLAFQPAARLD